MVDFQLSTTEIPAEAGLKSAQARYRVWESNSDPTLRVVWDLSEAVRRRSLWVRLAWQDVLLRYRRSLLGPFWLTLSMGLMVAALGIIYGDIFKVDMNEYLPFLTVSLLVWNLMQSCIGEGCQTFIEAEWIIRQINLPLSMFPLRVVCRNIIIFLHNVVIYLLVVVVFQIEIRWSTLIAIPALLLLLTNALWCAMLLGMLSARFRDLPQIVSSMLQIAFFATPVIWRAEIINNKLLVLLNPFYHFIELVRAPLLGHAPPRLSWFVVGGITLIGGAATLSFYRFLGHRIPYWV